MIRLASVIALFCSLLLIIPFQPHMPSNGIDPSWAYALNEALSKGMVFGRDFVFTLGPLGSVLTRVFHPQTDLLMLTSALVFGAGLCLAFAALTVSSRQLRILLFMVIAATLPLESLFMVLPFMVLLLTARLCLEETDPLHLQPTPWLLFAVAFSACLSAITPLSKSSFGGPVGAELGLAFLLLLFSGRKTGALAFATLALIAFGLGWVLAGQPLDALWDHLLHQEQFISGYSTAMSAHGGPGGLLAFFLASIGLSTCFYWGFARGRGLAGFTAVAGLLLVLFVVSKAAFVRHDSHQLIAGQALLVLGLVIAAMLDKRHTAVAVVMLCFIAWATIEKADAGRWPTDAHRRIQQQITNTAGGITTRLMDPDAFDRAFAQTNLQLRNGNPLPSIKGTVDLYPFDVAILYANGLEWSGRPVLQSYAAYTPKLDALDAAHLSGPRAPDNVFFSFDPIDQRMPSLEDSGSLPELLSRYEIVGYAPPYIHMRLRDVPRRVQTSQVDEVVLDSELNAAIPVPSFDAVLASFEIRPTLLGRIVLTLYKLPGIRIALTLSNGETVRYRYIPNMGSHGFILSPLLHDTEDFLDLAEGAKGLLRVTSLQLETRDLGLWDRRISAHFKPMTLDGPTNAPTLLAPIQPPSLIHRMPHRSAVCYLDAIAGKPAGQGAAAVISGENLRLRGWAAMSPADGVAADQVWIELKGPDGVKQHFAPSSFPRPDVVAAYKQPGLFDSGFVGNLDLRGMPTSFELSIHVMKDDSLQGCGQPVHVTVLGSAAPKTP